MLHDLFSRKFNYLRLSVTEVCNFRCRYCLPDGYRRAEGGQEGPEQREPDELRLEEVRHLLQGAAQAGFRKLRLTGGEPTLRRDLLEMVEFAARIRAFRQIALSTNGWNLKRLARPLREAGLTNLNVSVDSLDAARFRERTGRADLDAILGGVEEALGLGFDRVKLNAVLHADSAEAELECFLGYVKTRPVSVRFIELMRTRGRPGYRDRHFVSAGELRMRILRQGWVQRPRGEADGPAVEFVHPDHRGSIGFIAPHAEGFCESCNRLRVTSRGRLRLCLFGEEEFSLRPYLQDELSAQALPEVLAELLRQKPRTHLLEQGRSGLISSFSQVGG